MRAEDPVCEERAPPRTIAFAATRRTTRDSIGDEVRFRGACGGVGSGDRKRGSGGAALAIASATRGGRAD